MTNSPLINTITKKNILLIDKFNQLDEDSKIGVLKQIFFSIYEGERLSLKNINDVLSLINNGQKNESLNLPEKVLVKKIKDNEIKFFYHKNKLNSLLIFLLLFTFLFACVGATYSIIDYFNVVNMNKDLDNDGIADINIDLNNDRICDINCDSNHDNIPDYNIDYKGNRQSIFNVDKNHDKKQDFNLLNQDLNNDGVCDINCDINNDGWPDINIDINGDGKADLDIDTDNDRKADLNLDLDGDKNCDLNCDINNDLKCDNMCTLDCSLQNNKNKCEIISENNSISEVVVVTEPKENGTSKNNNPNISVSVTPYLRLIFEDTNTLNIENVLPTDQPNSTPIPTKTFTIENDSDIELKYNLKWIIGSSTFTSNNFKYKVESNNGGGIIAEYIPVPKTNNTFLTNISIAPHAKQQYVVSFQLEGINQAQDEDQGKEFNARINAEIAD